MELSFVIQYLQKCVLLVQIITSSRSSSEHFYLECYRVGAENVVNFVAELLVGREYLLRGFSQFLPPACRSALLDRFKTSEDSLQECKKSKPSNNKRLVSSNTSSMEDVRKVRKASDS